MKIRYLNGEKVYVYDYSTLKQDERSKLHRNMYKVAYPEDFVKRAVKTDDLVLI